jgi:hypothetical protein
MVLTGEETSEPAVVISGGGYRAVNTSAGSVEWSCRHVHFTDRSARNCAEQHLKATNARTDRE